MAKAPEPKKTPEPAPTPATCENCRFVLGNHCRRFPPAYATHGGIIPTWPVIKLDDWCGEFKEAEPGRITTPRVVLMPPGSTPEHFEAAKKLLAETFGKES